MENHERLNLTLSVNQLERALSLNNDIVSEALCGPIDAEQEEALSKIRASLRKMAEIFFLEVKTAQKVV